jgi:hypothetical protein
MIRLIGDCFAFMTGCECPGSFWIAAVVIIIHGELTLTISDIFSVHDVHFIQAVTLKQKYSDETKKETRR